MTSKNKIYILFIAVALIFWNPLSYFLFYDKANIFSSIQNLYFYLIYSAIFLAGIVLIALIIKNKLKETVKNLIFSISLFGILFSTIVFINHIVELLSDNDIKKIKLTHDVIFEPNSIARYQTSEFEYEAIINSIGLRDNEIDINKGDIFRILCFGDSWTYGWGVDLENSYPKLLQKYLYSNGYNNIEVINCGRPGMYTKNYIDFMKIYVPLLKPDLVLIGILQYEDLSQIYTNKFSKREVFSNRELLKIYFDKLIKLLSIYLERSFGNFIPTSETIDISAHWAKTNNRMIDSFQHWQNVRFTTLNDTIRKLFKSGDLEPGLLDYYINYPDRVTIFNNPDHPATQYSIEIMKRDVAQMRDICYENNSDILFINIPMNYFTGHIVDRNPNDILNDYYLKNNNIDKIYKHIADAINVPYIEMTNHFINLKDKSNYLFKYDGHPNKNGYREIATYIGQQLIKMDLIIHNEQ